MEYAEEDFIQLSGIQHFIFCRRQWGLINIAQAWEENFLTAEGRLMHDRAHDPFIKEKRKDVIISRAMPIMSRRMGVTGECDVVEFTKADNGITLNGREGKFKVCPVEYKRGSPKANDSDRIQLAAQAMCLEEMLLCRIDEGALFYGETRRREHVEITDELRIRTEKAFREMHDDLRLGRIAAPEVHAHCAACSLKDVCMPKLARLSASDYIRSNVEE